ncbi:uncharacterized protein LOC131007900 [Salvia miltiorrhiza]|uniref:uncharacterized protein LOC131007900 n=1 Tax=Salvia miltiorrhiza TaxID=226208 RepID=UPI0025AC845B|nr:uncharacterized protein LOC131007900 [Salvia miltiorrhiza]
MEQVWDTPAPQKARLVTWRILRKRLPTCDNLRRRNIHLGEEESMCNACCHKAETINHLFLECPKTTALWNGILNWLGINGPWPSDVEEHFKAFVNMGKSKSRKFLAALLMCVIWILWKSRNDSRFEGKPWDIQSVLRDIKVRLWSWNKIFNLSNYELSFSAWMTEKVTCAFL